MRGALETGGRLVLYVPQGPDLYSSLDEVLGHRCRYTKDAVRSELEQAGYEVQGLWDFNRLAVLGWWLNGKVLRRRHFDRWQLKAFDLATPMLRLIDRWIPWRGLGIVAVARKSGLP
jgi:hypothetical protein